MTEKLKNYQVLDVFCGGTLYKVRHKVTNSICAWKACDCSAFSDEQIQNVVNEVKTLSKVLSGNFLRYYDTILHDPTKTLYFVLEYVSWQSVQELISLCKATDKYFTEQFIWYTLLELARTCKIVESLNLVTLKKYLAPETIFVGPNGEIRVNCFQLSSAPSQNTDLIKQVGELIHTVCYLPGTCDDIVKLYSDDLRDVIGFLTGASNLHSDVVLYHPTVLANTDVLTIPTHCTDIFAATESSILTSEANKCDSEKAVEQCRAIQPLPRKHSMESPIYSNVSPKQKTNKSVGETDSLWEPISPTIAALALELPGYVPRSRKPYSEQFERHNGPQKVSEETLSQQWMSRLIALREREESLNRRERNLIAKEIVNSPSVTEDYLNNSFNDSSNVKKNGITLPQVIGQVVEETSRHWVSRRHQRRSSSLRTRVRRKSYAYEDLDSSLSADNGDSSMIITAAKITKDNMPCRNVFPQVSTKKVHFTSSNPFIESDDSVTLTFYELDNMDSGECQRPRDQKLLKDITQFKYLDMEKSTTEKRVELQWSHSSPTKQVKQAGSKVFSDITNKSLRQTPTKSNVSKTSMFYKSQWSKNNPGERQVREQNPNEKLSYSQTPRVTQELRKSKRKSLLSFKTPFKFKTSAKVSLV